MSPAITEERKVAIARVLDEAALILPGMGCVVSSPHGVLFEHYAGKVDVLDKASPIIDRHTIQFFASTTKLLTSVAVLQLIDRTSLTLDTPASIHLPELATPLRIFDGIDDAGCAKFRTTSTEITIRMLLNQSAGFGGEFREKVTAFKRTLAPGAKGAGFVNSCKLENLVNTPITEEPGAVFQYGNCCEWLGLLIQNATGQSLEDYMQENIFRPLGMTDTTFFPFEGDQKARLMPLRWWDQESEAFEVLGTQFPGLTLPRAKQHIEYAVGGGGIYSNAFDYSILTRHLLRAFLYPQAAATTALLQPATLSTLFAPSLSASAGAGITALFGTWYEATELGELDWSTGMCVYMKRERRGGWGRRSGTAGWMGAGGTEFFIDPESQITVVFSTNLLPFSAPEISKVKVRLEKAIYAGLVEHRKL